MFYKVLKSMHKYTMFLSFSVFLGSAGTADFYTKELYRGIPESVDVMFIIGFILMIPSALVMFFDILKEKYIEERRKQNVRSR